MEASSVRVSLDHRLDERLVYHIHLFFAVLVFKLHLLTADDRRKLREIVGYRPVERDIGKRCLRSPAARRIDPVNERLDTLLYLAVAEMIHFDKRRKIGVKGRKRLSARPLVLHNAEEVHHLVAEHGEMLRRSGGDLSGNAAQSLLYQLL